MEIIFIIPDIPQELFYFIWKFTGIEHLLKFRLVSKDWGLRCLDPQLWCTLLEETQQITEYNSWYPKNNGISSPRSFDSHLKFFEYLKYKLEVLGQDEIHNFLNFNYEASIYLLLWEEIQKYGGVNQSGIFILEEIGGNDDSETKVQTISSEILFLICWLEIPGPACDRLTRSLLGYFRFIVSAKMWGARSRKMISDSTNDNFLLFHSSWIYARS